MLIIQNKLRKVSVLFSFVVYFPAYSMELMSSGMMNSDVALLKAHTELFRASLKQIKDHVVFPQDSLVFVSYSHDDATHKNRVKALCYDFVHAGIPTKNILFDQWTNRPGGHSDLYQNVDKILRAEKVILIGSTCLKAKYDQSETRTSIVCKEIDSLRQRITQKGVSGIIPIWFENNFEDCFPDTIRHLVSRSLVEDYYISFFDLIIDLYMLNPCQNPILAIKDNFIQLRDIPTETLRSYGERLLKYEDERRKQSEEVARGMLEESLRVHAEQESGLLFTHADSCNVIDIEELRPHIRQSNIEITPDNIEQITRLGVLYQRVFKKYDKGIYIRNWQSSRMTENLLELLLKFSKVKTLKVEIDWQKEEDEGGISEVVERVTSSYSKLINLDLSNCRLTNQGFY